MLFKAPQYSDFIFYLSRFILFDCYLTQIGHFVRTCLFIVAQNLFETIFLIYNTRDFATVCIVSMNNFMGSKIV